jgi:hypothetical protein
VTAPRNWGFLILIPLCGIFHLVVFIESAAFTLRLRELAGESAEEVLNAIQDDLVANPQRGSMVQGLGGIRKARTGNPRRGKGKRGGFRYWYLFLERRDHIHLLILLDKDEQEDLDFRQRATLRRMTEELKRTQEAAWLEKSE